MTRIRRSLVLLAAVLALGACAGFPRAQSKISAFGFEAGIDTRKLTDDVGNVTASMIRATGAEPPVIDASATVTASAASESVR